MARTSDIGSRGEDLAETYLKKKGYEILERNFRCFLGEIDIIALKGDEIIFVEVKTRDNVKYGYPADFVTEEKQARILKAAEIYVEEKGYYNYQPIFDVIEVFSGEGNHIEHIEDAFP